MQEEYIGYNSIENLGAIMAKCRAKKVLLFCGKASFEKYKRLVVDALPCAYDMYNDFEVNPKYEHVQLALEKCPVQNYDMLVAVGGGSVIDFAKLYKYYGKGEQPLVAVPTTAGTGSEVTQFAIVYIEGEKHTVDADNIYPEYAIVDSQLLLQSPKHVKACTAMDAFCQAMESYWAVASTEESRACAKQSLALAHRYIKDFVNSEDVDAATHMALASNLAGKAIQISKTTAAHALCYKLTSDYGIAHGHAVALSMMDLFAANASVDENTCQDPRGVAYVHGVMADILQILQVPHAGDFKAYWQGVAQALGLEMSFKALGVNTKESIFATVNEQRLKNNPKNLKEDLAHFWLS